MTQKQMIMKYIEDFGSITSWEAYAELGITQLGARIYELEKLGVRFNRETVYRVNRYDKQVKFTRYSIKEAV